MDVRSDIPPAVLDESVPSIRTLKLAKEESVKLLLALEVKSHRFITSAPRTKTEANPPTRCSTRQHRGFTHRCECGVVLWRSIFVAEHLLSILFTKYWSWFVWRIRSSTETPTWQPL